MSFDKNFEKRTETPNNRPTHSLDDFSVDDRLDVDEQKVNFEDLQIFYRGDVDFEKRLMIEDKLLDSQSLLMDYFCIKRDHELPKQEIVTPESKTCFDDIWQKLQSEKEVSNATPSATQAPSISRLSRGAKVLQFSRKNLHPKSFIRSKTRFIASAAAVVLVAGVYFMQNQEEEFIQSAELKAPKAKTIESSEFYIDASNSYSEDQFIM